MKKPYLPPRVEFEEIEADEREMLLDGSYNTGSGDNYNQGEGEGGEGRNSLDLDFSMDFVVNDEPQL